MMENVPDLAKDDLFASFCDRLQELGYVLNHTVVNAADYGVPQRRRRLILLAGMGSEIPMALPRSTRRSVEDAISKLPPAGSSGDPLHDTTEKRTDRIAEMIRLIPRDGGSRTDLADEWCLPCHKRVDGFKDVYGRMAWKDVAPTLTGGFVNPSKGRFLHPEHDRAITLREGALIQTFPPNYKFPLNLGKFRVAEMIGNALPPALICAHAEKITGWLETAASNRED